MRLSTSFTQGPAESIVNTLEFSTGESVSDV
jgi:hypothetical protein